MKVKKGRKREVTHQSRFNKSSVKGERERKKKKALQEWNRAEDIKTDRLSASRQKTLYTTETFTVWNLFSDKLLMTSHLSAGSEEETSGGVCGAFTDQDL